jgi:hypothetical protein
VDTHQPVGTAQRAVLGRVGGQFVDYHTNGKAMLRRQVQLRTVALEALCAEDFHFLLGDVPVQFLIFRSTSRTVHLLIEFLSESMF